MMRAIDRTTDQFLKALKEAVPNAHVYVQKSVRPHGRSNYVYIGRSQSFHPWKVRISDHAVGMRRALSRSEDLYLHARTRPYQYAVWLGEFRRRWEALNALP